MHSKEENILYSIYLSFILLDDDPASQILQHYSDRLSQVFLTDSCIQLLYTEGLITEDTQRKIERCGGSLSDTLRELMIAVSDDHSKLRHRYYTHRDWKPPTHSINRRELSLFARLALLSM